MSIHTQPAAAESSVPPPIRILLADDHHVVREGFSVLLNQQPDFTVIGEAASGREAVELWPQLKPDVGLIDLKMPVLDGIGAIRGIRAENPTARLIILTTLDAEEDVYQGIRAGARAYLLKDAHRDELFACIRRVHAGELILPPALADKLAQRVAQPVPTSRELRILELVAKGASNKAIGEQLSISEGTVKTHVKSLFNKLDVLSRTEAVNVAVRRGLIRL